MQLFQYEFFGLLAHYGPRTNYLPNSYLDHWKTRRLSPKTPKSFNVCCVCLQVENWEFEKTAKSQVFWTTSCHFAIWNWFFPTTCLGKIGGITKIKNHGLILKSTHSERRYDDWKKIFLSGNYLFCVCGPKVPIKHIFNPRKTHTIEIWTSNFNTSPLRAKSVKI